MSGPLGAADAPAVSERSSAADHIFEVSESRSTHVGTMPIRRALPQRTRRTVGAWCFADHAGPVPVTSETGPEIAPHPHLGLQTVTWIVSGEVLHRDSLGSEQLIRSGELNLMTAGKGIAHAEERPINEFGSFHAIQLWVAQPDATRNGEPAFEHHAELPRVELDQGEATVLVGNFAGLTSPARRDTEHVGIDLDLRGPKVVLPLELAFEYAFIVLNGAIDFEGRILEPGYLAYLGAGRDECALGATPATRAILLGGLPFDESILMWWNFVARDRAEMDEAFEHWSRDDGWFGQVDSRIDRVPVPVPPWRASMRS
ncbi:MAG: Pirin family protein [Acidimicrobiaceae bacterium]|jgi:redox-sensitive bicupin YhaK (pirin superfamily)|nr:Pirin family protein [Acidimicrobiaceae bacterium]